MIGMVGKGVAAASAVRRPASLRAGQLEFHHQYMSTKLTQIYIYTIYTIPNQQKKLMNKDEKRINKE
jgi:tmRNA-binding protein